MAQASMAAAKQAQAEGSPLATTVRTTTVWDGSTGSNRTTMSGLVSTGRAALSLHRHGMSTTLRLMSLGFGF